MRKLKKRALWIVAVAAVVFLCAPALAWESSCIEPPYGWQYQDDTRSITINQVSGNGITYFVADVQLSQVTGFQTALDNGGETVSSLAETAGAVLAVNGDDCGTHDHGIIIRNGKLLRAKTTTRNLLIVDANGDMAVKTDRNGENSAALGKQLIDAGVWQSFEFGPELVSNGEAAEFNPAFNLISTRATRLEPRTAIGQIGPLHYVLLVVDGRQEGYSEGITLPGLQQLFLQYGAEIAMNLDGGGSTEIWFQGQILNKPSGGVERTVTDILYF
jgi:exopolysaccharide biosynthesis protein